MTLSVTAPQTISLIVAFFRKPNSTKKLMMFITRIDRPITSMVLSAYRLPGTARR